MHEAHEPQGVARCEPLLGNELLRHWAVDLSTCRQRLADVEVERIILDAPAGKSPGPDGIHASALKRFFCQLGLPSEAGLGHFWDQLWALLESYPSENLSIQGFSLAWLAGGAAGPTGLSI